MTDKTAKTRRGPAEERPLNLLGLRVQNYKRIELAEIKPDGSLLILQGENGAGKSSLIDALIAVLGGKRMMAEEALRAGAETGEIVAEIGPAGGPILLTATRYLKRNKDGSETSELVLETPKGPMKAAQHALDALRGDLSFNPVAFVGMPDRERAEQLLQVAGLDFGEHDADRQEVFENRTVVGQEQRTAEALALEARPESGEEAFEVVPLFDLDPLRAEVEKISASVAAAETHAERQRALDDAAARSTPAREKAEAALEAAQEAADEARREEIRATEAADRALEEPGPGIDFLRSQKADDQRELEEAQAENVGREAIAMKQARLETLTMAWNQRTARYEELTEDLAARDQLKIDALAAATFPLPEISVTPEGEVRFGDFAFDEAQESDRIRASIAMAMAANPKLRIAIVKEGGSGLGPGMLELIQELSAGYGGLAIVEMVYTAEDQPGVIHVVDGFAGEAIPGGLR